MHQPHPPAPSPASWRGGEESRRRLAGCLFCLPLSTKLERGLGGEAFAIACALSLLCCSRPAEPPPPPLPSASPAPAALASASAEPAAAAPAASASASAPAASASAAPAPPRFSPAVVERMLQPEQPDLQARAACEKAPEPARCLLGRRYEGALRDEALRLYDAQGSVLGLEPAAEFDGGYRGRIRIVPELPAGKYARHLDWVTGALDDFQKFFAWLGAEPRYRWAPLGVLFFRSVGKRTPAAYASGWRVAYNLEGGINTSADLVRETMFHEIFHLNDAHHSEWSDRALGPIRDAIVARCGARTPCLTPFAPGTTMVRNGTYYAFQPGNGVAEYAAELALRYYTEHRLVWLDRPVPRPFKCGPDENRRAWKLLVDEFFAGVDRVPACPAAR